MTEGVSIEATEATPSVSEPRRLPGLRRVRRRGPLLRFARGAAGESGLAGIDLTAGCGFGCSFCYIRGSARYPGPDRLLFDPAVASKIGPALDTLDRPPTRVVLSPSSDPLPPIREVREATIRVIEALSHRGIGVTLLTRGQVPRAVARLLALDRDRSRVAVGFSTLDRSLSRALEPLSPPVTLRLRGLARLVEAGVPVEARVEPLIPGLTDTRENLRPLFRELARIGVRDVLTHYVFLQPAVIPSLREALRPLGLAERLTDLFEGGPVFSIGELGATKHLPIDTRREGLARLIALGAEFGLEVRTGASQNPDFPQALTPPTPPPGQVRPRRLRRQPSAVEETPAPV